MSVNLGLHIYENLFDKEWSCDSLRAFHRRTRCRLVIQNLAKESKIKFIDPTPNNEEDGAALSFEFFVGAASTPIDNLERKEQVAKLKDCISRLAPVYKEIIKLRFYLGLSYTEIREALEKKLGTVKSRIARAAMYLKSAQRTKSPMPSLWGRELQEQGIKKDTTNNENVR